MKLYGGKQQGNNLYDRNPKAVLLHYHDTGIAPAADTQRWIYTVPAGRRALVGWAHVRMWRDTVAAPPGQTFAYIEANISAGGNVRFADVHITTDNVVSEKVDVFGDVGIFLAAGDTMEAHTGDTSTGGQIGNCLEAAVTEFDQ